MSARFENALWENSEQLTERNLLRKKRKQVQKRSRIHRDGQKEIARRSE